MAAGFSNPAVGFAVFGAVKLAGYTAAAALLRWSYGRSSAPVIVVGLARTVLGVVLGIGFGLGMAAVARRYDTHVNELSFYIVGLIVLRIMEWSLIVWFFFDRELAQKKKDMLFVALGILWSFFLDVPAIIGLISTGGLSIC
ncbi:MAG: hypothetical protein KIS92_19450 [Planctomycetota bacterium]|nr:hypothetical protein [Planctomycetota bacterium]